jgi:hypothetical protein
MILTAKIDIPRMKRLILENLWHYQKIHHADNRERRWTFMLDERHPQYATFAQALLVLIREGLVAIWQNNGQCYLTDRGYDYCESNSLSLSPEDRFFEDY